jgi:hypothetical protein
MSRSATVDRSTLRLPVLIRTGSQIKKFCFCASNVGLLSQLKKTYIKRTIKMIVKHISRLAFLGAAFAFIGIGTSNAQIIITPTSANASSEKGVSLASNTIDGSGLFTDATQTVADNSISGIHFTDQSGFEDDNGWVWEDGSTTPSNPVINGEWIEFDLGAQYELSGAYVWQTTFSTTGRQTRTFDIDTSTDDVSYTTKLTNALLPQVTTLTDGSTATYFDFGTTVTARYVRF